MSFVTFTWLDRITANPNRRTLTNTADSSDVKTVTVTRDEGTVTQEGTPLNAQNLNSLESRILAMNNSLVGTAQTVELPASGWNSSTHLITVNVTGVTATTSNQEIFGLLATSPANIQNNAKLAAANIQDYGQANGSITLYAENVPSDDLTIRVIVRV